MPPSPQKDVVIVGAGMAGLYCAWRLQSQGVAVTLLETLDRVGGRIDTDVVEIDGVQVKNEEGGMRFMANQTTLYSLLTSLQLTNQIGPFSMGDTNNRYCIRGNAFSFGDASANNNAKWSTLYNLNPSERNQSPGAILSGVLNTLLTNNSMQPPQTPEDWQNFRLKGLWKGIPLYEWGFWSFLTDYGLSQECIKMLDDTGGFKAPFDKQGNAGAAFQLMGDFVNPQFNTLIPGYSALPESLYALIVTQGADVRLQHHVNSFDRVVGGYRVDVTLPNRNRTKIDCKALVLALPQKALRVLSHTSPPIDNILFRSNVGSVIDMPLTKVNAYYETRWWYTGLNLSAGGSFADLPMAQLYTYMPMVPTNVNGPASLTMYCDYFSGSYWASLQSMGMLYQGSIPQPAHTQAASIAVVQALQAQLQLMLPGISNMPMPVLTTYKQWGNPRYGDGDHMWAVGANDAVVMPSIQSPSPGLVICGETYSDNQAWVDGALRSVDAVLATNFDIGPLQGK